MTASRVLARTFCGSPASASRRSRRRALVAVVVVGGSCLSPHMAGAQASASIADLDWLAGGWVLERAGERLEERWSQPVGNSMVGHFRWIRGDELWITELVSITAEGDETVFRLRHFSAEMRPWEAEDDAFVYRLTDRAAGRAAFTISEPRAGRPTRFIFEALPGDSLLVRLEGEEDGRPTTMDFRYGRGRR